MNVRTYFDATSCDACRRVVRDPVGWFTLNAHFDVQEFGALSNGALNSQINRRHYDACSERCAKRLREQLLTIHRLARR